MTFRLLAALAASLVIAAPAAAADPPIREFPLATVVQLGRAIYAQDSAAWVATDALQAEVKDLQAARLVGWIVLPNGDGQKVRFLRDAGAGLEAGYDIDVTPDLKTRVYQPSDRTLTAAERAMFVARQTAAAGLKDATVCRPGYNSVVLKDPERDGWLVWSLAPMPKLRTIPIGIHYRFTISADGTKIIRRDALSKSCGVMDPTEGKTADGKMEAVGMTHLVSKEPVETEVFLQLQYGLPMFIMTDKGVWAIENGAIRVIDPKPR
jgi:hypothetical protein